MQALELNSEFQEALNLLEKSNANLFITGKAGSGKSTLLQLFRNTTRKKMVVLAPTGVAALNVQGQTVHSFFGFPAKPLARNEIRKRKDRRLYKNLEVLVIDEISMVRADLMDNIDYFLRINRENPLPFGGVQVVFFGDVFQLPPVVSSEEEHYLFNSFYDSPFFFSAKVFDRQQGFEMIYFELHKVYRQESRHFLRLLDAIRTNTADYEDMEDLNTRHDPHFEAGDYYITLSTRNALVDQINLRRLLQLDGVELTFNGKVTGEFDPRQYPVELALRLREGAQVMFVKNDPNKEFVNGTIGKITTLRKDKIQVSVEDRAGKTNVIDVLPFSWEILKYELNEKDPGKIDSRVVGTFEQYPLRLAWAITIHKSQGKTFDKVIIDLGAGAFEHGQTYVALSRCRTLDGIVLRQKISPRDVMVDERVVEFYESKF